MKVLVTGAGGQLGLEILKLADYTNFPFQVIGFTKEQLDVTNMKQAQEVVQRVCPTVIVHAAAYTAVDLAETQKEQAFQVNAVGARNVAVAAEEVGAKLCYISTDYVFDGTAARPYQEYDPLLPINVYGKSKLAGEQLVQTVCSRYFIVRTAWLYGNYGDNFVKTMLQLARERERLKIVHDQQGSPTYTKDLAFFIFELIQSDKYGIYHATNTGSCTWYEFAQEIFKLSETKIETVPCKTEEFPRPAKRPKYTVLDHLMLRSNGFKEFRHWKEALQDYLTKNNGEQR